MSTLRYVWAMLALTLGIVSSSVYAATQIESFDSREACEQAVVSGVAKPYTPRKQVQDKQGYAEKKLGDIYDGKFAAGTCHNGGDTVHGKRFVYFAPDFLVAWKKGEEPLMWKCMNDLDLENAIPITSRQAPPPTQQNSACPSGNCSMQTSGQANYTHTQTILVDAQVKYVCKATGREVRSPSECVIETPIEPPTIRLQQAPQTCCNIVAPSGARCTQDQAGCCKLTWTVYKN